MTVLRIKMQQEIVEGYLEGMHYNLILADEQTTSKD